MRTIISSVILSATLIVAASAVAPYTARADETGMASMHDQARVGGRLCFTDHTHNGNSSGGARSRAAAMAEAIASWRNFTDFEYGSRWASYSRAIAKRASCSKSSVGWECSVEARPCR